jgi:hypothetical protein
MKFKVPGPEGHVYLAWSEKLSIYKIGYTKRTVRERVRELNEEMGVGWEEVAHLTTKDVEKLERLLHTVFSTKRVVPNREWFTLTYAQAQVFIMLAEDQRLIREKAYDSGMEAKRSISPISRLSTQEWISLAYRVGTAMGGLLMAAPIVESHPIYSQVSDTFTLVFPIENEGTVWFARRPDFVEALRGALEDMWGYVPRIEIQVAPVPPLLTF